MKTNPAHNPSEQPKPPTARDSVHGLFADFFRWVAEEIKTIRRDWRNYALAIGGWRLMPQWCQRNRCHFGMWNDPDGRWTVKVGVFEHSSQNRAWATVMASIRYFDAANTEVSYSIPESEAATKGKA